MTCLLTGFGKEICPEALLTDRVIKVLRSAFSISSVPKTQSEAVEQKISVPTGDKFPRTELLLSAWQLIEEGYPLPYGSQDLGDRYVLSLSLIGMVCGLENTVNSQSFALRPIHNYEISPIICDGHYVDYRISRMGYPRFPCHPLP